MVLSKRERYIVIGVGAALSLLVLDHFLLTPYTEAVQAVRDGERDIADQRNRGADALTRQSRLRLVWAEITNSGLRTDPSEADSQARHAVLDWMQTAGVNLTTITPDRPTKAGKFQAVGFHVTGTGSMPAVARLLWSLETATIPMRIGEATVKPRKEGTDELTVDLTLSTLAMPPDTTPAKTPVSSAAGYGWERS